MNLRCRNRGRCGSEPRRGNRTGRRVRSGMSNICYWRVMSRLRGMRCGGRGMMATIWRVTRGFGRGSRSLRRVTFSGRLMRVQIGFGCDSAQRHCQCIVIR